jgi:hypothetical protein
MRIDTRVERIAERSPEDDILKGWLEESSVYVSVEAVDDGELDDPPAEA